MYEYSARIINVIDGDTVEVAVDLGFRVYVMQIIRLYGIDAPDGDKPELRESAKVRLQELLPIDSVVTLRTIKTRAGKDRTEKYGRFLGVFVSDQGEVNSRMVQDGHATGGYFGGRRG